MAGMESLMQCEHYAGTKAALLKLWSPDQLHIKLKKLFKEIKRQKMIGEDPKRSAEGLL